MKLMKRFKNKNLAKAVCLGLLSTGGVLGLANSACAADYISADAKKIPLEKGYVLWVDAILIRLTKKAGCTPV